MPGSIPIASDAWTLSNRIAFLALTASWITKDWELVLLLLDFIELKGAHSGANMAGVVFESLIDLDMKDKVNHYF